MADTETTEARIAAVDAWTGKREGRTIRAYYSADGWRIAKAKADNGWSIFRPNGTHADNYTWPNLLAAQLQAFEYGQRA